jgi:FMN-dependent NADH-azoreductase
MAHLLRIDSSIQGDRSVSRKLTARARDAWLAAHPGGTVTYWDLGSPSSRGCQPLPTGTRTTVTDPRSDIRNHHRGQAHPARPLTSDRPSRPAWDIPGIAPLAPLCLTVTPEVKAGAGWKRR